MPTKQELIVKAYKGTAPYVFISYARQDADTVIKIVQWLEAAGYRVWYDEGIKISEEFTDEIGLSLKNCSYFIVFVSNFSISRKFVQKEINFAEKYNKPIMPVFLEKNVQMPAGIDLNIGGIQGVEYYKMSWDVFTSYIEEALPPELRGDIITPPPPKLRSYWFSKLSKKMKKGTKEAGTVVLGYILQIIILLAISLVIWFLQNKFDLIGKIAALFS